MSKIFGKRKDKKKKTDFREHFASASLPASVAVVPRTAIVPDTGLGSLSQSRPFHSLPPNDGASDDTDSSLIDYQRGKHTTSYVSAAIRSIVNPPEGFGDPNSDTDHSFEDRTFSAQLPMASFRPGDTEISVVSAHTPSLNASRFSDLKRTDASNGTMRHTAGSGAEDLHSFHSTLDHSKFLEDVIESQMMAPSVTSANQSRVVDQTRNSFNDLRASNSVSKLPESLRLEMSGELEATGQSIQSLNGQDYSHLELQERIYQLESENRKLNEYIDFQKHEPSNFTKVKDDAKASGVTMQRKSWEEAEMLKNLVHRLNTELDVYHKKFRKLTTQEMDGVASFPVRGPKPSWLVNTKYLAPLLVAYDDRLKEKESIIAAYESKLSQFQEKSDEILKENNRLHIRLEQTDVVGPMSMTEWRQLQEQCKLVLEENQVLMEQLDLQQNKEKEMRKALMQETSTLVQKVSLMVTEKAQTELEVNELREKLGSLKQKYDDLVVDSRLKVDREDLINAVSTVKQTAQEETAKRAKELAEITAKMKTIEVEKDILERELEREKSTVMELQTEIKNKLKAEKKYKKEIEYLQLTINDSEILTAKVKQYLATVLKTAKVTATERDNLAVSVQEQEKIKMAALKKLSNESIDVEKIRERMKAYNIKKKEKLDKLTNRLKEQGNEFSQQREEFEREIRHLRQLVRDKEETTNVIRGEKRIVLEDLETVWQAASNDSQRMQGMIRQTNHKLQEHVSLHTRLFDDPEPSSILDQMLKLCGCDDKS